LYIGKKNTIKKNKDALLEASREVGPEENAEKIKYMSCYKNAEQNHNLMIADKALKTVTKLKYMEMTVTIQNCIHENIRSRLNSGNACYHSV
jgi:hypothetical protein